MSHKLGQKVAHKHDSANVQTYYVSYFVPAGCKCPLNCGPKGVKQYIYEIEYNSVHTQTQNLAFWVNEKKLKISAIPYNWTTSYRTETSFWIIGLE